MLSIYSQTKRRVVFDAYSIDNTLKSYLNAINVIYVTIDIKFERNNSI